MIMRYHDAPSFVSEGKTFLSNPSFTINNGLESIFFDWEIKCLNELPEISLRIIKITSGRGRYAVDFSEHFIFPEEKKFPVIKAIIPRRSAILNTRCIIKFVENMTIPLGKFALVVEISFLDQQKIISQIFHLKLI